MHKENISKDRQRYLRNIWIKKASIILTQIGIIISFISIWEICANKEIIDSFITSQPSRILQTFINLSENQLLMHLWVTCEETLIRIFIGSSNWNFNSNNFMVVGLFKQSFRAIFGCIK